MAIHDLQNISVSLNKITSPERRRALSRLASRCAARLVTAPRLPCASRVTPDVVLVVTPISGPMMRCLPHSHWAPHVHLHAVERDAQKRLPPDDGHQCLVLYPSLRHRLRGWSRGQGKRRRRGDHCRHRHLRREPTHPSSLPHVSPGLLTRSRLPISPYIMLPLLRFHLNADGIAQAHIGAEVQRILEQVRADAGAPAEARERDSDARSRQRGRRRGQRQRAPDILVVLVVQLQACTAPPGSGVGAGAAGRHLRSLIRLRRVCFSSRVVAAAIPAAAAKPSEERPSGTSSISPPTGDHFPLPLLSPSLRHTCHASVCGVREVRKVRGQAARLHPVAPRILAVDQDARSPGAGPRRVPH
mmetsp:Transcript_19525/g.48284  ORF Transcript_19525/g.48284 Transcript_19525/m.48284 type:complete len:358 (+) Transcript_19525:22-1095(+)